MQPYIRPKDILDQRCTKNGDGTGDANANEDYSGGGLGATKFFVQPSNEETFELYTFRMIITTATAFESGEYGDGAVLTNGVTLTLEDDTGIIHDFLNGATIKNNATWGVIVDLETVIQSPNSPAVLSGNDNFVSSVGAPIRIVGSKNQRLVVTLSDDMTSRLTNQEFSVAGQRISS